MSERDLQRGKPRKNSKRQRGIYKGDKTGNIQSVKGGSNTEEIKHEKFQNVKGGFQYKGNKT